nr:uncharacterized protein LOC113739303 [Coffea arabica]
MAEGTRLKGLEEQLKRQEIRTQGIMDSWTATEKQLRDAMAADRQHLEEKIESSNNELKNLIVALSNQYGAAMRTVQGDRGILQTPTGHSDRQNHLGRTKENSGGNRQFLQLAIPRMEFPVFDGGNPREWIRKSQKYFHTFHIPDSQKMDMVEIFLEGKADIWYQGFKISRGVTNWENFTAELIKRFGNVKQLDPVEEFSKLQQTSTVQAYQEKFEELMAEVVIVAPSLPESFYISCFLSGLNDEIRSMVKMHDIGSLSEVFKKAKLQESANEAYAKKYRPSSKIATFPSMSSGGGNFKGGGASTLSGDPNRKLEPFTFKKITPTEIQHRRAKGLCFRCGEKYTPNHKCGNKEVHMLVVDEVVEAVEKEMIEEEIEYQGRKTENHVELTLHSISGTMVQNTIKVQGDWLGSKVSILVDGGSSHSFIKASVAFQHPELIRKIKPFKVKVANGESLLCNKRIPQLQWVMQGHKFSHDFYILDIEPYDMIIGVDWMKAYSPLTFDFKKLQLVFDKEQELVTLQGDSETAGVKLHKGDRASRIHNRHRRQLYDPRTFLLSTGSEAANNHQVIPEAITTLLTQFDDVFEEPHSLPPSREFDHHITLIPDSKPFKLAPYRYPHMQKSEIEKWWVSNHQK